MTRANVCIIFCSIVFLSVLEARRQAFSICIFWNFHCHLLILFLKIISEYSFFGGQQSGTDPLLNLISCPLYRAAWFIDMQLFEFTLFIDYSKEHGQKLRTFFKTPGMFFTYRSFDTTENYYDD